jgi:parallel beta-helix repeat protein
MEPAVESLDSSLETDASQGSMVQQNVYLPPQKVGGGFSLFGHIDKAPLTMSMLAVVVIGIIGVGGIALTGKSGKSGSTGSNGSNYTVGQVSLQGIQNSDQLKLSSAEHLAINGELQVNGGVVITPSAAPKTATAGQIYFDSTTNQLYYYDGTKFVPTAPQGGGVNSIGGAQGVITVGNGLQINGNQLSVSADLLQATSKNSGTGVTSFQGQSGDITLNGGDGVTINGTTISNSGVVSIGGATGSVSLGRGLTFQGGALKSTISLTSGSPNLTITDDGNGNLTITDNGSGSGSITLGPPVAQVDPTLNTTININKTGAGGGFLQFADNGTTKFAVDRTGLITAGTIAYGQVVGAPATTVTSIGGASGAITLGSGLSIAGNTLSNSGVLTVTGTANQVSVLTVGTNVTLSLPQDINTTSNPTFNNLTVQGGSLVSGVPGSVTGYVSLSNAASSRVVKLQGLNPSGAGDATVQFPSIAGGGSDIVCLQTLANCSGSGSGVTSSSSAAGFIPVFTTAQNISSSVLYQNGTSVGVNTTTPGVYALNVQGGDVNLSGNATIGNGVNVTGASSFAGNTSVTGTNTFTVGTGATTLGGTLGVTGATTLAGLTVNAASSFNGNVGITGSNTLTVGTGLTTLGGDLTVAGTGTFNGAITQSGANTFSTGTGNISLNGNTSVTGSKTFTVGTGATVLGGTLNVAGLTTLSNGTDITGAVNINTTGTAATTIGNSGATLSLTSSGFSVTAAGAVTGVTTLAASGAITAATSANTINGLVINGGNLSSVGTISTNGAYTQTGVGANTFSGATTFSAAGTALTVNNNATVAGTLTTNTITSTGALTIGNTAQSFVVQGNGSSVIKTTDGGFNTTIGFNIGTSGSAPTGAVSYQFLNDSSVVPGTYNVCTTAGNCVGVGGSVTTTGGTAGKIAKFTSGSNVADSIIGESGSIITIGGNLNVGVSGSAALTLGVGSTTSGTLVFNNASNNFTATFTPPTTATGNTTLQLPNQSGTVAVAASGPIVLDALTGQITCPTCLTSGGGAGGGVSSITGSTSGSAAINGALTFNNAFTSGSAITIDNASTTQKGIAKFNATNFSDNGAGTINTIQDISTSSTPSFGGATLGASGLTVNGASTLNGAVSISGTNTLSVGTGLTTLGGGLTATGAINLNTTGTANTAIGNTTGTFSLASSALKVSTAGALSGITTLALSGAITGATSGNTINGLVINSGALSAVTGYAQTSGNFAISGGGTFDTGTGAVNLNGNTSVTGSGTLSVGSISQFQVDASGNVSTSGTFNGQTLGSTSIFTGGVNIQGAAGLTLGVAGTTNGLLTLANSTSTRKLILQGLNPTGAGDATLQIPSFSGGSTDTVCLQTLANCASGGVGGGFYINNQTSLQTTANFNIQSAAVGSITAVLKQLGSQSADILQVQASGSATALSGIDASGNIYTAAGQSIKITGSAAFPSSPTEGQIYYRTDTKQLYVYANAKWQADRSTATKIVADDSTSQNPESADYVVPAAGTSAQTTINAAIAALPAAGGTVYLREGTYTIDGAINLPNNVTLTGAGNASVIYLKSTLGAVSFGMVTNSGTDHITVSNLKIDGNSSNQTGSNVEGIKMTSVGSGSGTTGKTGVKIQQVTIVNTPIYGIDLASSRNSVVTGNSLINDSGVGTYSLYVSSSQYNTISNNVVEGATSGGIVLSSSTYNTVTGNIVQATGRGIYVLASSYNTVSGNTVNGNSGAGVILGAGGNNTISGNNLSANSSEGIQIFAGSVRNNITGNTLYDNGAASATSSLSVDATSANNLITSNLITDTAGSGFAIAIASGAAGTYLSNNTYSGTGATSISDAGNGTIMADQLDSNGNLILRGSAGVGINTTSPTASLQNAGGFINSALSAPAAPTVTTQGTAGSTGYTYAVTAYDGIGETLASTGTTIATGNATLNGTNFNRIVPVRVSGAVSYKIYRTASGGTPATTGLIGTLAGGASTFQFDDTGIAGGAAVPAANTTGSASIAGNLNVSGSSTLTGIVSLGTASSLNGQLKLYSAANTGSITLQGANTAGNYTVSIPATISGNDTICLVNVNNCAGAGANSVGSLDGGTANANGATIASNVLYLQSASASFAGLVNTTTQTLAGAKTFSGAATFSAGVTVAASQSISLVGGITSTRPSSPTAGMLYYDTTTNQMLQYNGSKWVSDRSTSTKIVAASNSSQAIKDSADYIATGTGDQATINTALTAAAGGSVYLAEGTYNVASPGISIPNNTTLFGAGAGTLITIPNAQNGSYNIITNTDTTTGTKVSIHDLQIDGNKTSQTGGSMYGIYFNNMGGGNGTSAREGAKITNVIVKNLKGGYGIYLVASSNNTLLGNTAQNSDNYGIYLGSISNYNTLNGNIAQGNDSGIYINSSSIHNTVTGNNAQGNNNAGIYLNTTSYNTISGNNGQNNSYGIYATAATYNTISGNTWYAGNYGMSFNAASNNNNISSNTVVNGIYGLEVQSSSNNAITSNTANNNSTGISLNIASNNTITGNTARDNVSSGFYLSTVSNSTVSGNKLYNNGAATDNNGIVLQNGSIANTITGNDITDTSCSVTCYAINIAISGSTGNLLSANRFSSPATINDLASNTIYDAQMNGNGDIILKTTSGKVGVNTLTPAEALNVYNGNLQVDYGNIKLNQVTAPGAPTVAVNATAGNLTGPLYYVVTFVTATGETNYGTQSASVNPTAQQVDLSAIPTGTSGVVTARKIYRGATNGGQYKLVTTLNDNTTTTYTDNIAPGALTGVATNNNTTGGQLFVGGTPVVKIAGAYSANSFLGVESGLNNINGTQNTALGYQTLRQNTTGSQNVALGYQALFGNTTGSANTAIGGYGTLLSNSTGNYNIGVGEYALTTNTSGSYNIALGFQALNNNSTGNYNIALGGNAANNVTGSSNITLGFNALAAINGSNNTIMGDNAANGSGCSGGAGCSVSGLTVNGYQAGFSLQTGADYSSLFGYQAGYSNTTGGYNTNVGYQAGYLNQTGSGNVFIGKQAGYNETASNKLYIANSNTTTPLIGGDFSAGTATINGAATIKSLSGNSTSAFQIQNNAGNNLLTADTTNMRLAVNATYAAMTTPTGLSVGAATAGGSLAATTTYYYKVTALDSAGGETIASTEASAATTGINKTLPVTWTAVSGASGYKLYRSTTTGTEVYLKTVLTNSYTDTGSVTIGTATPPVSTTAYASTNTSNNNLQLSVGGNGTPTGQVYVSGTVPTSPISSFKYCTAGLCGISARNAVVQGKYAYVLSYLDKKMYVLDVSNPASPAILANVSTGTGFPVNVAVQGKYAYLLSSSDKLLIYDITNPSSPTDISSGGVTTALGANSVYVSGRYVYVLSQAKLQVFDLANPYNPTDVSGGGTSVAAYATSVYIQGKYAYVIAGNSPYKLIIFDISNPASPTDVSSGGLTISSIPRAVYVSGRYAYIATSATFNGIQIVDVSNPASPVSVSTTSASGGAPYDIFVQGRYAYVADAVNTLSVYDVSNPGGPKLLGNVGSTSANARSVYVSGRYAYVMGSGDQNLYTYDLGGTYSQQLEVGGADIGTLQVDSLAQFGGDTVMQGGLSVGQSASVNGNLGVSGIANFQNAANSTTAFQIQNATGSSLFTADTTNSKINVGLGGGLVVLGLAAPSGFGLAAGANSGGTLSGTAGSNYYYKISAVNANGESLSSSELSFNGANFTPVTGPAGGNATATAGAGLGIGLYYYEVSYVTANGETADTSTVFTATTTAGNQAVNLTSIPVSANSGVIARKVYRTVVGAGGARKLLTTINDNTTTVYADTTPDGSLGAAMPSTNTATTNINQLTVNFLSVPGATSYRVYRGTSAGAENTYFTTASPPYTDTGSAGTAGAVAAVDTTTRVGIGVTNPTATLSVSGNALIQSGTNSTTAVQIQNSAGNNLLTADTTNMRLAVNATYAAMTTPTGLAAAVATAGGSLTATTTYFYKVTAIDSAGGETAASTEVSRATTGTNMTIPLTWTAVTGASGYKVYRATTTGTEVYVTTVLKNAYTDDGTILIGAASAPGTTTAYVSTNVSNNSLQLTVGGNGTPTGQLYVGGSFGSNTTSSLAIPAAPTITAQGVTGSTYYSYAVAAVNANGVATNLSAQNVVVNANSTLTGSNYNQISWAAVTGAVSYNVYRVSTGGTPATVGLIGNVAGTTINDTGLAATGSVPTAALASIATSNRPDAIATVGRYTYVGTFANGLQIYDTSNPAAPVLISTLNIGDTTETLVVQGRYAYLAGWGSGNLKIVDVSNPAAPAVVGSMNVGRATALAVSGRYAYVGVFAPSNLVQVIDISKPTAPVQVGSVAAAGSVNTLAAQGRYLYAGVGTTLQVLDITNPALPVATGSLSGINMDALYVQGRYLYGSKANGFSALGFSIVDISNPASPVSVSSSSFGTSVTSSGIGATNSFVVQGRYAYIAYQNGNSFVTLDISNPAKPTMIANLNTDVTPDALAVSGRYAYVVNNTSNTLQVFDIGGAYIQQLEAGGAEVGTLAVDSNANFAGDANLQGTLSVGQNIQAAGNLGVSGNGFVQGTFSIAGGIQGGVTVNGLSTPAAPTVTFSGTTGTTATWSYQVVAVSASGGLTPASATGSISAADNATLSAGNFNVVTWTPVSGAVSYKIYRTAVGTSPATTGLIATTGASSLNDTGLAGDSSTASATNTSGQFTLNGPATFNEDNLNTVNVVSDLTAGSRSGYLMTLSQANNASNSNSSGLLQLTNSDTNSTAALLNVNQVANGTAISITGAATGTGLSLATTTGTGIVFASPITTGTGISFTSSALTSGNSINIGGGSNGLLTAFTSSQILINPNRTNTATSGTLTDSGSFLNLTRANAQNGAGGTFAVTGSLATLQSNCTQTAGTCTDTSNILNLNQQYANASGSVALIQNSGTGKALQVQNGSSVDVLSVDTVNAQTILTAGGTDAVLGVALVDTSGGTNDFPAGWGAPAGWTLAANSATHTAGTTALTSTWTPTVGVTYQVKYSYSSCSAVNNLSVTMGGQPLQNSTDCVGTNTQVITATSATGLSFTPSATYVGVVSNVLIKALTTQVGSVLTVKNSSNVATLEVRSSGSTSNLFIGLNAGKNNTNSATQNTALGSSALQANTTGSFNTATGYNSLQANTTGTKNVATGNQTLQANTTGSFNTATGYNSLQANTIGNNNTATGSSALLINITGNNNTATGSQALMNNITGNNNTATGYQSLVGNGIGSNNTAMGNQALSANSTGSNNTATGYLALQSNNSGGSNTSTGVQSLFANTTGTLNTAIGTSALRSNNTGSFNSAAGSSALYNLTTVTGTISATANNSGKAQFTSTSTFGLVVGAVLTISGTTSYNGSRTIQSVDSGTTFTITAAYSTADAAGSWTTVSADGNTATGYQSGLGANNGYAAVGNSLYGYNTGLALQTTANYNSLFGYSAGSGITTGTQNVLLGYNAGTNLTTGSNNIILGAGVNAGSATGSNQLNIGDTIYGDLSTDSVGIGTSTLTSKLNINGDTTFLGSTAPGLSTGGTGRIYFDSGVNLFQLSQNGNAYYGICTTSGNCTGSGGGASTLQTAYGASTGGTTPEIKLNATQGALDFQDADTTLGGNLLAIRASNAGGLGNTIFAVTSANGAVLNATGTAAFQIQNAGATAVLFTADTTNKLVKIGTGTPTLTAAATGGLYVTDSLEVAAAGLIRVGNTTDGFSFNDGVSGKLRLRGTARNDVTVKLAPEFNGAVLKGDGSNNTGTMTADFCSGSSKRNINATSCGSTDEYSYYEWTTTQGSAQDYDMYVNYNLPSNLDSMTSISLAGFRSTGSDSVVVSVYSSTDTTTPCVSGVAAATSNGAWTNTSLTLTGCTFNPDTQILFKITTTATNGNFARVGPITFVYKANY